MTRRTLLAAASAAPGIGQTKARKAEPYRIIDPHVHVWKLDRRFPWAKETTSPPTEDATPEMLLDLMRQHGVAKTVIIQVIHYRWDNSFLADVLTRYPQYFKGVARVNPEDPAAPDHLSKLAEQGFQGVRISPAANASGNWIDGPLMPPLWKRCEQLKIPMTVLTSTTRLPAVAKLAAQYPNLTVVIDHMADCPLNRPEEFAKLAALEANPRIFVKISHTWAVSNEGFPFRDSWGQVKRLYDKFGPRRLMWGTDWPVVKKHASYAQALAIVRDEMDFLNADDRSWLLSKTPERVWPFGA